MDGERRVLRGVMSTGNRKAGPPPALNTVMGGVMPLPTPLPTGSPREHMGMGGAHGLATPGRPRPESMHVLGTAEERPMRTPGHTYRRSLAVGDLEGRATERYGAAFMGNVPMPPTPTMGRPRRGSSVRDGFSSDGARPRRGSILGDRRVNGADMGPPRRGSLASGAGYEAMSPAESRPRRMSIQQGGELDRRRPVGLMHSRQQSLYQQQLRDTGGYIPHHGYGSEGTGSDGGGGMFSLTGSGDYVARPGSAAATDSSNGDKIEVKMKDLDCEYETLTIKTRTSGMSVQRLGDALMERFHKSPAENLVSFYRGGVEMRKNVLVTEETTLYYRIFGPEGVVSGAESVEDPAINLHPLGRIPLARVDEMSRALRRRIPAGLTVHGVRQAVADMLGIEDADDIMIEATNGVRPGPLAGGDWRLGAIALSWLCTRFEVYQLSPRRFISMRLYGTTKRYLIHMTPQEEQDTDQLGGQLLQCSEAILADRFYTHVLLATDETQTGHVRHPTSLRFCNPVSHNALRGVRWGNLVDVKLDQVALSDLADYEAWLLGPPTVCHVCCEERYPCDFPVATRACRHDPTMCQECLNNHLLAHLSNALPETLACPDLDCSEKITALDLMTWAKPDLAVRFAGLATTSFLRQETNFYWCTANCGSGQIHASQCPEMICFNCRLRQCIHHSGPWHEGLSCRQVDAELAAYPTRRTQEDRLSRRVIRETAQKCPVCASPVELRSGCNHITCSCGAQWCWVCLGLWERDRVSGVWHCRHVEGCEEERERPLFGDDDDVPDRLRRPRDYPEEDAVYLSEGEYEYPEEPYLRARTPARSVAGESAYQYAYPEEEDEEEEVQDPRYWREGARSSMSRRHSVHRRD